MIAAGGSGGPYPLTLGWIGQWLRGGYAGHQRDPSYRPAASASSVNDDREGRGSHSHPRRSVDESPTVRRTRCPAPIAVSAIHPPRGATGSRREQLGWLSWALRYLVESIVRWLVECSAASLPGG